MNQNKNNFPLVTIIIPSYNHEKYIVEAVNSVLSQTYKNIELIVIDDGSEDNSVNILQKIKDPRLRLIVQKNMGAPNAINKGLELAKGEYIGILNSDDAYHIERIGKLLQFFGRYEELELAATYIEVIDERGERLDIKEGWKNLLPWPIKNVDKSYANTKNFNLNLLMSNFVASTSNIFVRKGILSQVGYMRNLRYTHDWDFLLRICLKGKCDLLKEPLLRYRIHKSNTINTNRKWMLYEICWVIAANIDKFLGKEILTSRNSDKIIADMKSLYESINLQGNDKIFWIMRLIIEAGRREGINNAEEILLDKNIREEMMRYIIE